MNLIVRKPLLDMLAKKPASKRPIWLMRQAGRYLPEYRAVRARAGSFLDLCYNPELAAEVTLQPLRRYDLDAAIVFADILVVPHAMGAGLSFVENEGPKLEIIESQNRVDALTSLVGSHEVLKVCETLVRVKASLPADKALIGFCGAPWTIASYLIEGGSSKERARARAVAIAMPDWFRSLMDKLVTASIDYLEAQVQAGAEVLQIFDSWAQDVPWHLRDQLVIEPIRAICAGVAARCGPVPVIAFARGVGPDHVQVATQCGAAAIGVEQSLNLAWMFRAYDGVIQGNVDPVALYAGGAGLDRAVDAVLAAADPARHIFNLGHGILQGTPPEHVTQLIERIRKHDLGRTA